MAMLISEGFFTGVVIITNLVAMGKGWPAIIPLVVVVCLGMFAEGRAYESVSIKLSRSELVAYVKAVQGRAQIATLTSLPAIGVYGVMTMGGGLRDADILTQGAILVCISLTGLRGIRLCSQNSASQSI
jgi:hypothetical protein